MIEKSLAVILWISEAHPKRREILLLQVTAERGGFWQSPTGHREQGESFCETALREAEEETGLQGFRQPQFLGLDYQFQGRWGPVRERAYLLLYCHGTEPPTIRLDPKEHQSYHWMPAKNAAPSAAFPMNQEAIHRATQDQLPLYLSSRGDFYHEGVMVTHEKTVALFHRSLQKERDSYFVGVDKEKLQLFPESYAHFVSSVDFQSGLVHFLSGKSETFNPNQIEILEKSMLLYKDQLGNDSLFLTAPYYEILKKVSYSENPEEAYLHMEGSKIPLRFREK